MSVAESVLAQVEAGVPLLIALSALGLTPLERREVEAEVLALQAAKLLSGNPSKAQELAALRGALWPKVLQGDVSAAGVLLKAILAREDATGEAEIEDDEIDPREALRRVPLEWLQMDALPPALRPDGQPLAIASEAQLRAIVHAIPRGWLNEEELPDGW